MKKKYFNNLGISLVETMIAIGVTGILAVTVGSLTSSSYKLLKEVSVNQALGEFKTLVKTTANSSNKCPSMIIGAINPNQTDESMLTGLLLPPNLEIRANYSVQKGSGLVVKKISFKKLLDTYGSMGGANTFNAKQGGVDYTFYPIAGNIIVEIENQGVKQNKISGLEIVRFNTPVSITFRRLGGGAWAIYSCNSEAPITILKEAVGWQTSNLSDSNFCVQRNVLVAKGADSAGPAQYSGTATCPEGMYFVSQTSQIEKRFVDIYYGSCSCAGDCRDCVCVSGSSCSTTCDKYSGAETGSSSNCMGTCHANHSCNRIENGEAVFYHRVIITCCKVRRE